MEQKKIIFTGGGSAGHVTPNLALIKKFKDEQWDINYVGSVTGIEKELIAKLGVPYHSIATGKLRRYFSWQNFYDPFKIVFGIFQAIILCWQLKPKIIFSKGGFVSFPLVIAAWLRNIPVIIHESDLTIGLANRLCFPFSTKICLTFPETIDEVKNKEKVVITGTPIRQEFFAGDAKKGLACCDFTERKKIILIFGGSLGSLKINKIVRELLPTLLEEYQVAHVCGKDNIDLNYQYSGYKQFEYLKEEFPHLLAAADLVISRSGANSIYELIALRKPSILIPLSQVASRGDQISNALYFRARGFGEMLLEEQLTARSLLEKIAQIEARQSEIVLAMENFKILPATDIIFNLIVNATY